MIKNSLRVFVIFVLLFCCNMTLCSDAMAYIDLGSGSYLFQIIIASLLSILFTLKIYWKKLIAMVKNLFSRKSDGK